MQTAMVEIQIPDNWEAKTNYLRLIEVDEEYTLKDGHVYTRRKGEHHVYALPVQRKAWRARLNEPYWVLNVVAGRCPSVCVVCAKDERRPKDDESWRSGNYLPTEQAAQDAADYINGHIGAALEMARNSGQQHTEG